MGLESSDVTPGELIASLDKVQISGRTDAEITALTHDSREVTPGALFVCLKGAAHDGHAYALQAVEKGAAALVVNAGGLKAAGVKVPPEVTVITLPDTRRALPLLSCAFYGNPSHALTMVGVTGTNGKTTTTRMIAAILRAAGKRVGTIGTLGAELDGEAIPSEHTTPEADQLQNLLATMRDRGADAAVMEVSSHALAQFRTDGIAFSAGVFTNITQDHLDFHETMEAYFEAKARLFAEYPIQFPRPDKRPFVSVINVSAWEGRDLVTLARGEIITFSTSATPAVLQAEEIELSPTAVRFTLSYDSGIERWKLPIALPIGGAFQVSNALAAIGATLRLGVPKETIAAGLAQLPPVPGRFESVPTEGDFSVVVDYAHTPDGLENLLRSARELNPKRILVVFGCGGNRDRTKRPKMGRLAGTMAEVAIVTSDNPRKEDPDAIIAEILTGMDAAQDSEITAEIYIVPDRRKAIIFAVKRAQPGDLVVIAGKGHEDYQIVGDQVLSFDDRVVAREALSAKETVIRTIKESFEDAVYPGDDNLFGEVYDPDIPDFLKILRGKHWKETLSILEKLEGPPFYFYQTMFGFMTPVALHYFTPAFLIIALEPRSDVLGDHFECELMPDRSEWGRQRFSELISLFSDRQKYAIALAVDYMGGEYMELYREVGDERMLQYLEYWSQWLDT